MHGAKAAIVLIALSTPVHNAPQAQAQSEPAAVEAGFEAELRNLFEIGSLPRYRTASQVAMVSSYDRTGGNDDGFTGTYSYLRREGDHRVLAELQGPGTVNRIFTPAPTNKHISFYFDGEATPRVRVKFHDLFSGDTPPFNKPVVGQGAGGYYSYLPIPYKKSLKIVYEGDDVRFHQIQYRTYPQEAEIESFSLELTDRQAELLNTAATLWAKSGARPEPASDVEIREVLFDLGAGDSEEIFAVSQAGGRILGIEVDRDQAPEVGQSVFLEAIWDDDDAPAILSPLNDFFGYAYGAPATQGLLLGSRGQSDYSYLPMPFDHAGTVRLRAAEDLEGRFSGTARIYFSRQSRKSDLEGRLYTSWRREHPEEGKPYTLLEA